MELETLVIVLAGGEGSRLWPLTDQRTKPAVPIGGKYRLIDIPLSNAFHSGLRRIHVVTQGKDESLNEHIKNTWPSDPKYNSFVRVLSPQGLGTVYEGDADAVRQVRRNIMEVNPKNVLIVPGDHLLKMHYGKFVNAMAESNSDAAISLMPKPLIYASQMGSLSLNENYQVTQIREKEKNTPLRVPGDDSQFYASMGIYCFTKEALLDSLELEGDLFGKAILPQVIGKMRVLGYDYKENNKISDIVRTEKLGYLEWKDVDKSSDSDYWRDVGTIGEFYDANMDLVSIHPAFNIYSRKWKFFTYHPEEGPAKVFGATNAVIASGGIITKTTGENNLIFAGAYVDNSHLNGSIAFPRADVQRCNIARTIIDKNCVLKGLEIGHDDDHDQTLGIWLDETSGIRVVPKGYDCTSKSSVDYWKATCDLKRELISKGHLPRKTGI